MPTDFAQTVWSIVSSTLGTYAIISTADRDKPIKGGKEEYKATSPTPTVTPTSSASNLVIANLTTNYITIDGILNESEWNINSSVTKTISGTNNNTVTCGVLFSSGYLFVGVKVLDASLQNDSTNPWDDELQTCELFYQYFPKSYRQLGFQKSHSLTPASVTALIWA